MLAMEENRMMTIADYEARIYLYKEQIGVGYIGIGRTLIEAKEADVVPHGEWQAWVEGTTGLTLRQAQRCMQAAREIRDGSQMARLEMSKALLLLSSGLDEKQKEELAGRAAEEGATVRELREEIKRLQEDFDAAQHMVKSGTEETVRLKLEALDSKEAADRIRADLDGAREENRQLRGQLETVREYVEDQKKKAAEKAREEARQEFSKKAGREADAVREGYRAKERAWQDARDAAQRELEDLRADLAAAEKREEKRARELEELRAERQRRAMDDARGLRADELTGTDISAAVRSFLGAAGVLPQMGDALRMMNVKEREAVRRNVEAVAAWVEASRAALGARLRPDGDVGDA